MSNGGDEIRNYDCNDVSKLLFSSRHGSTEPFVGPIGVVDTNQVVQGRGLVATRDVAAGECLFITPPTVCAPVADIRRILPSQRSLESITETVLLKNMKRSLRNADKSVAASFMLLTDGSNQATSEGDGTDTEEVTPDVVENKDLIPLLLGRPAQLPDGTKKGIEPWWKGRVDDKKLLGIIRHNAFGPEFHNYDRMAENVASFAAYGRVLGMYPVAAMINHSCEPNAVRVFAGETMIVHACTGIKSGEEIVWSYIPTSKPWSVRQEQLLSKFGFQCCCHRCSVESSVPVEMANAEQRLADFGVVNAVLSTSQIVAVERFDKTLKSSGLTNEHQRYRRVSFLHAYLNLINTLLMKGGSKPGSNTDTQTRNKVMSIATETHLALSGCNNACTEHISILHLCYELSSGDRNKAKFWADQLRRAHCVRYGKLGNDVANVRPVLQHTRTVLRSKDGMLQRKWLFL